MDNKLDKHLKEQCRLDDDWAEYSGSNRRQAAALAKLPTPPSWNNVVIGSKGWGNSRPMDVVYKEYALEMVHYNKHLDMGWVCIALNSCDCTCLCDMKCAVNWSRTYCTGHYSVSVNYIWFELEKDAVVYKLSH